MASVTLKNVYKVYEGGVRAVSDFNLEIKDKEFIVFVGPSGCGKSTTLRMVAGLEDITAGQLYIDGQLMNDVDSKNRDIAMVFQSYALYPHMTVYQNMAFGLKLRHEKKEVIDQRVKNAAEILEISDLLSRKPKALSGGQRQRVALGRTIVREPKVFLLDEPLSNLDAKLRVAMRSEITKLHDRLQTTFIYVTHDQTEAMTMGTRIVVMKDGFIQQVDTPITLFEDPANLFVATFLGSPQMNILDATLFNKDGKLFAKLYDDESLLLEFPEIKAKELADPSYIGKKVKLGIRPENVSLSDKGIPSYVEVVEHLGDETILYTKINGRKENFLLKIPFIGHLDNHFDTKLNFNMDRVYLFDYETGKSIMGVPSEDDFPIILNSDEFSIGKQRFQLCSQIKERLLHSSKGELFLSIKPDYISFEESEDSYKLNAKVEFVENRSDYNAYFFSIEGVNKYFAIKAPLDKKLNVGEHINIYIPFDKITILSLDKQRVQSREIIYSNIAKANVTRKDGLLFIRGGGLNLSINDIEGVEEGLHDIEIDQEKVKVVFTKKFIKSTKMKVEELPSKNRVKFMAYDEDPAGNKNIIYGKIPGFENYVTLCVDNNFSVYKMPEFQIYIPENAIKIN